MSEDSWKEVKKLIYELASSKESWISEHKACDFLGIQKATLLKRISKNKVTKDMYCNTYIKNFRFYKQDEITKLKYLKKSNT